MAVGCCLLIILAVANSLKRKYFIQAAEHFICLSKTDELINRDINHYINAIFETDYSEGKKTLRDEQPNIFHQEYKKFFIVDLVFRFSLSLGSITMVLFLCSFCSHPT